MKILLKTIDEFPNWSLAIEFLRRSSLHFLIANEMPPIEINPQRRDQIILRGVHHHNGHYLVVPDDFTQQRIRALCRGLVDQNASQPFIGSVRSSNFMTFLGEFTIMLKGKVELAEVAQAIVNKTSALFNADGASILVPDEDGSFRFAYHRTVDSAVSEKLDQIIVPGDRGVTGWVNQNRRSILVNEDTKHLIFNAEIDKELEFHTAEIMASPISIGDNLLGILEVLNPKDGSFQESDLQTLELIAGIIAVFIDKANLYESRLKYAKIQQEFEIAHKLQTRIMPSLPSDIGSFRLSGESRQITHVGGDFWDVFNFNDNEKLLIIGDVSGHGLSAALMMSAVRTSSRALLHKLGSPYPLIEPLNYLVNNEFSDGGHYVTLILCHLIMDERRIKFFRAGHEKPILKTAKGYREMDHDGGLPIGLLPFRKNDPWHEITLAPGEELFFYTDGVLDGMGEEELTLDELLTRYPELEAAAENNEFFDMLVTLGWKNRDDATFLKLRLSDKP